MLISMKVQGDLQKQHSSRNVSTFYTEVNDLESEPCHIFVHNVWEKVFKNGPSKICGRQLLKDLKEYGLLKLTTHAFFLKVTLL